MKRAFVTGGTGVTGVALVRYLLSQNVEVVAVVRPSSTRIKYLPTDDEKLTIIYGSMEQVDMLEEKLLAIGSFDAFFNLAWDGSTIVNKGNSRDDMLLQSNNIVLTVKAVELCDKIGCKTFVMTGSQAEFGICGDVYVNESMPSLPVNGYGNAKLCAENMTRIMCKKKNIKHIWARLFSIYGPYDGTNSLIYTSILKLLKGERPAYTPGEQKWDFMYSFDAAKALYLLAEHGRDGEMYCVANGQTKDLKEYISIIHDICAPEIKPVFGEIPYGPNQVMFLGADISKLKADTGFEAEYTFDQGIEIIKNWCIETKEEYV